MCNKDGRRRGSIRGLWIKGCFWKVTWMEDPSPSSISGFPLSDRVRLLDRQRDEVAVRSGVCVWNEGWPGVVCFCSSRSCHALHCLARLVLDLASNLVGFDLLCFALLRSFKRHLGSPHSASIQVSLFGICFVMPFHCFLVRAGVIRRISKM